MIALWLMVPAWWPVLLALPLVLLAGAWLAARSRRRSAWAFGSREAALLGNWRSAAAGDGLAVAAAGLATVALLHPVALDQARGVGADVVLAVDVSRSMAARDAGGSRLAAAVAQLDALAAAAGDARLALLAFGGRAEVLSPLTADRAAVAELAHGLQPGTRGGAGTDLAAAIARGAALLASGRAVGGAIVLLTDGEDFGASAQAAAATAAANGCRVHCFAFGSETGSKIVVDDGGAEHFLRDAEGTEVVTRPDRPGLAAVAAAGEGTFVVAAAREDLLRSYVQAMVPHARDVAVRSGRVAPTPVQHWFLLAAALLWMLRRVIPERSR